MTGKVFIAAACGLGWRCRRRRRPPSGDRHHQPNRIDDVDHNMDRRVELQQYLVSQAPSSAAIRRRRLPPRRRVRAGIPVGDNGPVARTGSPPTRATGLLRSTVYSALGHDQRPDHRPERRRCADRADPIDLSTGPLSPQSGASTDRRRSSTAHGRSATTRRNRHYRPQDGAATSSSGRSIRSPRGAGLLQRELLRARLGACFRRRPDGVRRRSVHDRRDDPGAAAFPAP